ncbi:MAG: hypothetical protein CO170_01090 [candidate division SR1 bacterium CG_4_9_14_3_um_filter_40_9]|nr:MAG: hypothetical protein CO170_01090 [candidate division SR1 bacterium CG_4_9_14_3_um_filter_40_9]
MKKKGNISILVLFVLVASSLIGVLTMNFVNQMLYSSDMMLSYYESYYLANGGLELLLMEAKNRGIGFEINIGTGSSIFTENFSCTNCDFTARMQGTSTTVSKEFWKEMSSGCLSPIVLAEGESLMLPLIRENFTGTTSDIFTKKDFEYENLSSGLTSLNFTLVSGALEQPEINIGLIILSGDELLSDGIFVRTGIINNQLMDNFLNAFQSIMSSVQIGNYPLPERFMSTNLEEYPYKNYLILANTSPATISFCINSETPLPTDNFHITSNGMYHGQTIGLELIYRQPIPSFLMNSVLGSITSTEAPSEVVSISQK